MAVLTDILVAPEVDIPAIVEQWPGVKNWPSFQASGLDSLVLSDLAAALGRSALAQSVEEIDPASFRNEASGPWLYVLPAEFRDQIAAIPSDRTSAVAKAWSQGEEASDRGMTAQDAERLLVAIQGLATKARDEQKPMLLWVSS